jgi:hypothetical protein
LSLLCVTRHLPPEVEGDFSKTSFIPKNPATRKAFTMGQLLSRNLSVLASFDYVSFNDVAGSDLNTPRFWEGDSSESTLPTPQYVRSPNVTVQDIRGHEDEYKFSKTGFQLLAFPSAHEPHPDNQAETQAYLQETAAKVRWMLNASQAFVFDYRVINS